MTSIDRIKEFIEEKREQFRLERQEIDLLNLPTRELELSRSLISIKEGIIDEISNLIWSQPD